MGFWEMGHPCCGLCYRGTTEWFGSNGALMVISFHPLFCSFPQFPLCCSGSRASSISIFLGKRFHSLIPVPLQVVPSVIPELPLLSRAQILCHTQPGQAGALPSLSCSILPFFWDFLRAPGLRGILPALLWSSCSQLTKSTWTAVAHRGVGKCIHKVWDLCRRECSRCMAKALWEPSALKARETNPKTSPTSRFQLGEESRCCGVLNDNASFSQLVVPVHWDRDCSGTGIVCGGTALFRGWTRVI